MKKTKQVLAIFLVVAMMFAAVGCGGKDTASDASSSELQSSTDSVSSDSDVVSSVSSKTNTVSSTTSSTISGNKNSQKLDFGGKTVVMIMEWQPSDQKGIDASRDREIDRVAEINKKYNVNLVMKKGATNYNEGIVSSIASGTPIGHIIRTNNEGNGLYDFIRAGLCANLNSAIAESGIDVKSATYNYNQMKAYNVNDKQYVITCIVPQEASDYSGNIWFYNKAVLKELGYKDTYISDLCDAGNWNWSAVTELATKAIKKNSSGSVTRYGLGFNSAYKMAETLIVSNGGAIGSVNKNGQPQCDFRSSSVRQALEQLYNWSSVSGMVCTDESSNAYSRFGKGEIFMIAGGSVKTFYNSGVQFGAVYPPKGTSSNAYTLRGTGGGANFIIPVTYQKDAAKYLVLLNELYAPYKDASRETIIKTDQINYFSDSKSWTYFNNATFDSKIKKVNDPFNTFNLQWVTPAFGTVCQNLVKGELTAGTLIEKYNDQYQAVLDDLFKGYALTGLK